MTKKKHAIYSAAGVSEITGLKLHETLTRACRANRWHLMPRFSYFSPKLARYSEKLKMLRRLAHLADIHVYFPQLYSGPNWERKLYRFVNELVFGLASGSEYSRVPVPDGKATPLQNDP
ncbi:hypothetical protein K440DRAFT_641271 [Wilcoxina mikolae CBS 423.85]|nr:hypothetical protein K440DRAFT_641271 [Wilcoxina mikolae CBS 423.85]